MSQQFFFQGEDGVFAGKSSKEQKIVSSGQAFSLLNADGNGILVSGEKGKDNYWWISVKPVGNTKIIENWQFSLDPASQSGKNYLRVTTTDDVKLSISL